MENLVNPKELEDFYRNKRVFITGHTGFKGSWLLSVLQEMGAVVKGYALEPEQPGGLFDFVRPSRENQSVFHDIRDKEKLTHELVEFRPHLIFHLAAQPLVRRSYQIPSETFDVNVVGTANLLEAVLKLESKCSIIVITTDKVYQNKEADVLYKEDDVLGGYDPYSASKACCELVCDSFRKSFFNASDYASHLKALATARAGNVIGGGDWSRDRLLPDVVCSLMNKKAVVVRNSSAVRPWQHVLEAVWGYLILGVRIHANPLVYSGPFNFGPLPQDHLSVKDVVQYAIKYWGSGEYNETPNIRQPHEANLLKLDISKSREELLWGPKLNAMQAIEWTIDWYKQPDRSKYEFTSGQIWEYLSL